MLIPPTSIRTHDAAPEIRLQCKAVGSPQPVITWSRNGIQLISSNRIQIESDGSLVIRPVETGDHGTYRCDATNINGRVSAEADVLINGKDNSKVI